jgi:transposase
MARYKPYSYSQTKFIPISYERQILPATFEHTLCEVIDTLDMAVFEGRYRNDDTGAPAYDPRILLKVVLYAYSRGIIGSRKIAALCDYSPHQKWTPFAQINRTPLIMKNHSKKERNP